MSLKIKDAENALDRLSKVIDDKTQKGGTRVAAFVGWSLGKYFLHKLKIKDIENENIIDVEFEEFEKKGETK